jgi:hypothetical protein
MVTGFLAAHSASLSEKYNWMYVMVVSGFATVCFGLFDLEAEAKKDRNHKRKPRNGR